MSARRTRSLKRREVHPEPLIDGRAARGQLQRLRISEHEREEAELERRLRTHPGVTRPNTIALISPKGGVGKTLSTFVVGNLLASHLKLRAVAVDANPDFGTLARLASDHRRSERSLADLLHDADHLTTAAEVGRYVSRLPTGLHILAAPHDPQHTAAVGPDRYGELVALLAVFYEVVLLDLGTGVTGPLARFAIDRADQLVLVTTPEWITSTIVLDAVSHLRHDRTTVALNASHRRSPAVAAIADRFGAEHLHRTVTVPYDEQLATMLDTGTYTLDALASETRVAIKRLGLAVAEQLA
jgi:MinD-like ATPase involved in chromosome partitioning or flagellar assembly